MFLLAEDPQGIANDVEGEEAQVGAGAERRRRHLSECLLQGLRPRQGTPSVQVPRTRFLGK